MITVFTHQAGNTAEVERLDPAWLDAASGVVLWVDLSAPTPEETRILSDVFRFHELSVEDAVAEIHHPKIEPYPNYLYLILHGIDFKVKEHCFRTIDVDFFLGVNYLVTVHSGVSRSISRVKEVCRKNAGALSEGPAALMHRIVDTMVDNYGPEVEKLGDRLDRMEKEVFQRPDPHLARRILDFKRDISSLRRVVLPERDAVGRLARREFSIISEPLSYRFRDVYDHLVRLSDEAMFFQDRIGSLLDAHLAAVSNALNSVMKVLTIIATIFMPLSVVVGLYGMNVRLPEFPGGETAQFSIISEPLSYRFRDVYDHLVRLSDEAMFFQDRIGSLLDAHLAAVSNALNGVMKVLTIIATIFMPLSVVVGLYGMNVRLPEFPGGETAQFWWITIAMIAISITMLWFFRRRKWL